MRTTGRHRKLHRKGCRFMSNEKHNHLDTGKNEQSPTGGPKEVRARIKRLRSRGALVALPSAAAELVADIKPGQDLREVSSWCEGDWLPVVAYAEVEHGKRTQKLVSHIRIRYDPWNKVAGWQEDVVKTMEVTMVTAAGALGLIEPGICGQVLLDTLKPVFPPIFAISPESCRATWWPTSRPSTAWPSTGCRPAATQLDGNSTDKSRAEGRRRRCGYCWRRNDLLAR